MATRLLLAEQIQRNYKRAIGSDDTPKDVIDRRELFHLINQAANEVLGLSMQAGVKTGNISIPSSFIATYSNRDILVENGRYYALMPVYPIMLPRDMGVWSVVPQTAGIDMTPFIPICQDDWDILTTTDINDEGMLEGYVAYYPEGRKVFFTKNPNVTKVKMKLLISDPSMIGDNDPYPLTPEMESEVVKRVLDLLKSNTGGVKQ